MFKKCEWGVRCICHYGSQVMKFEPATVIWPNFFDSLPIGGCINRAQLYVFKRGYTCTYHWTDLKWEGQIQFSVNQTRGWKNNFIGSQNPARTLLQGNDIIIWRKLLVKWSILIFVFQYPCFIPRAFLPSIGTNDINTDKWSLKKQNATIIFGIHLTQRHILTFNKHHKVAPLRWKWSSK